MKIKLTFDLNQPTSIKSIPQGALFTINHLKYYIKPREKNPF